MNLQLYLYILKLKWWPKYLVSRPSEDNFFIFFQFMWRFYLFSHLLIMN